MKIYEEGKLEYVNLKNFVDVWNRLYEYEFGRPFIIPKIDLLDDIGFGKYALTDQDKRRKYSSLDLKWKQLEHLDVVRIEVHVLLDYKKRTVDKIAFFNEQVDRKYAYGNNEDIDWNFMIFDVNKLVI
jgi:hypothetical protein